MPRDFKVGTKGKDYAAYTPVSGTGNWRSALPSKTNNKTTKLPNNDDNNNDNNVVRTRRENKNTLEPAEPATRGKQQTNGLSGCRGTSGGDGQRKGTGNERTR